MADLQRVELPIPWTWRLVPEQPPDHAPASTTPTGERLSAEVGNVQDRLGHLVMAVAGACWLSGVCLARRLVGERAPPPDGRRPRVGRRRGGGPGDGAQPDTAGSFCPSGRPKQLAREYPEAGRLLAEVGRGACFSDARFPYLRTRPGRKRLQEIRAILAAAAGGRRRLLPEGARSGCWRTRSDPGVSAQTAAERLSALTTSEERAAFVALDLEAARRGAEAERSRRIRRSGTPRARGVVVAIQDALRADETRKSGVSRRMARAHGWTGAARGDAAARATSEPSSAAARGARFSWSGIRPSLRRTPRSRWKGGEYSVEPIGGSGEGRGRDGERPKAARRRRDDRDRGRVLRLQVRPACSTWKSARSSGTRRRPKLTPAAPVSHSSAGLVVLRSRLPRVARA